MIHVVYRCDRRAIVISEHQLKSATIRNQATKIFQGTEKLIHHTENGTE